jgi:hypothetical protein
MTTKPPERNRGMYATSKSIHAKLAARFAAMKRAKERIRVDTVSSHVSVGQVAQEIVLTLRSKTGFEGYG